MHNALLLVDDEPDVSKSLSRLLRRDKYQIYTADSGEAALALLKEYPIKVIISDQRMPNMSGSQLFTQIKEQYPDTIRIIISGYADFQAVSDAINQGSIYKFLAKPWNSDVLRIEVREAFNVQSLRQRNRQLTHLFDGTIEAIALSQAGGLIEIINPAFSELAQLPAKEIVGKNLSDFFFIPNNNSQGNVISENKTLPEYILKRAQSNEWHGELTCKQANGNMLPVWMSFMTINGPSDQPYVAALFIDITDQKQKEARIEFQAYHDELTGLANRRLFNDHLELALHQSKRHHESIAVLFIDLDRFKQINDTLGHVIGDQLLLAVSKRLSRCIRKGETLSRFGGGEFILILPSLNGLQECENVAQKIIHALQKPFEIDGEKIHMSASIGISTCISDGKNSDLLVRHADNAMYRAKELGGNKFQFYDTADNQEIKEVLKIENALHDAIKNEELVVYYQPQANPKTGGITSCEALIRWQHPVKGLLSPAEFIDVAEKTGLILAMGKYVLQQSCRQLAIWWLHEHKPICISVNISARQFNDPNLLNDIFQCINENNIEPQWLEVEITESILLNDIQSSIEILNKLRDMGVRIALDDFGSGYSSLSYLKELPISTLKIDQSFIKNLPNDKKYCTITLFILGLAKGLGLSIVAEGIENQEQYDFLCNEGCDFIQGYFVSPPINLEAFNKRTSQQYK